MSLDHTPERSQLGQPSTYATRYDPTLLYPIARATTREPLALGAQLPFFGADLWSAFELGWLNARGKPQVAIAHFTFPCETSNIVESKSLKLYLNSFNGTVFADAAEVRERLRQDLGEAAWRGSGRSGGVGVRLLAPEQFDQEPIHELDGLDLDRLDVECGLYVPSPQLLRAAHDEPPVTETLTSRLLRSNCPVTGQPDWGSVQLRYSGAQIDQERLLQYIVSFREHNDFHEHCVERIFMDVWQQCRPTKLAVYARYTRRGGLDINPFRASWPQALPTNVRTARQ
ncbi:MAG: NADPH-dependent 7-cyano-7-deazaguanine reductase QueF [Comamonadaceae bacterium]|nr:MAG: NADPH-dependent 7-cyano-7-deazaguanine reductase QueF [Comamonadaceae bacterium]